MTEDILRTIGIIGWSGIEDFILSALVLGDGVLLIGSHGSAKTYLCKRLAEALGVKFQKIDTSKAEFEDLIGFINPGALFHGKFEYVKTNLSIAEKDFVFLDEINRAQPGMQSKFLEIIYNRELMGEKTNIKWIFAAMNPSEGYSGAEPVDIAFASRFVFFLPVPDAVSMKQDEIESIILNEADNDGIALKTFWNRNPDRTKEKRKQNPQLVEFLKKAVNEYYSVSETYSRSIVKYLFFFSKVFHKEAGITIDGRRLSMLRRSALAWIAVRRVKGNGTRQEESVSAVMRKILPYCFPDPVYGRQISNLKFEAAFQLIEKLLSKNGLTYQILLTDDPIKKAKVILAQDLSPLTRRRILNEILSDNKIENILMPAVLAPFCFLKNSPFPVDMKLEIIKKLKELIYFASLMPRRDIVIRSIKDIKRLCRNRITGKMQAEHLINAAVKIALNKKKMTAQDKRQCKKRLREFLIYAKNQLQDCYDRRKSDKKT